MSSLARPRDYGLNTLCILVKLYELMSKHYVNRVETLHTLPEYRFQGWLVEHKRGFPTKWPRAGHRIKLFYDLSVNPDEVGTRMGTSAHLDCIRQSNCLESAKRFMVRSDRTWLIENLKIPLNDRYAQTHRTEKVCHSCTSRTEADNNCVVCLHLLYR